MAGISTVLNAAVLIFVFQRFENLSLYFNAISCLNHVLHIVKGLCV